MSQGSFGSEFRECHGHVALAGGLSQATVKMSGETKVLAGTWSSSQDSAFPRLLTHMSGEFLLAAYRRSQSPPPTPLAMSHDGLNPCDAVARIPQSVKRVRQAEAIF